MEVKREKDLLRIALRIARGASITLLQPRLAAQEGAKIGENAGWAKIYCSEFSMHSGVWEAEFGL